MPEAGVNVLVSYINGCNKHRTVKAFYSEKHTIEQSIEADYGDWDESGDRYYLPEGWHESIDNWDDFSSVEVTEGNVTHWMPLPPCPEPTKE